MSLHQWTETAIARALEGHFYLTDGSDRNARRSEAEEKKQKERAEILRQRTKEKIVQTIVIRGPADAVSIIAATAHAHGMSSADLVSRSRAQHIIHARQHACALMREICGLSLDAIAAAVSLKDHSTAHHGIRRWRKLAHRYTLEDAAARKMLGVA